jgi:hypothetical protein
MDCASKPALATGTKRGELLAVLATKMLISAIGLHQLHNLRSTNT